MEKIFLKDLYLFLFYVYEFLLHICVCSAHRGCQIPRTGATVGCELPRGSYKPILGPLEEEPVLFHWGAFSPACLGFEVGLIKYP